MTWITKKYTNTDDSTAHHYVGLSSLCKTANLVVPKPLLAYGADDNHNEFYCAICQKMLKSEKIQQQISQRKSNLESVQEETRSKFGVSLQDMLFNILNQDGQVKISELEKTFKEDYPKIHFEDIILPLVISKEITISEDSISPSTMEVSYVK